MRSHARARRLFLCLASLSALSGAVREGDRPSAEAEASGCLSDFARRYIEPSSLIALCRVESVVEIPGLGAVVVRMRPEEVLRGEAHGGAVVVLFRTLDGVAPVGKRQIAFLQRYRGGPRYTSLGTVTEGGPDYAVKLRHLRFLLQLEEGTITEARKARWKEYLFGCLNDPSVWLRTTGLREWQALVGRFPRVLDGPTRRRLESIRARTVHPEVGRGIDALLRRGGTG